MSMTMEPTTYGRPAAFEPSMVGTVGTGTERPGWMEGTERRVTDGRTLARFLGWFSIGLGAAEVLAPRRLTRALGVEGNERLVQVMGLREIAHGGAILSQRQPTLPVWSRVAGDALDLAALGAALAGSRRRNAVMAAIGAVAGVAVLDVLCGTQLGRSER